MNLLIVTQAVDRNDPVLGFFHRWIEEFAKNCERVTVICLREGEHALPGNVRVLSLGKEEGVGRLIRTLRLYRYSVSERTHYDSVFVHMNPEYILLCGLLWHLMGKRIGLWYVHKSVTVKLKIATLLAHTIFTASQSSFRLRSNKVHIVGHGIDTAFFSPGNLATHEGLRILSAGRLSPAKRHDLILRACALLDESAQVMIAGAPATQGDTAYERELHALARELHIEDRVHFLGACTQEKMRDTYRSCGVFVHTSTTGSYDKVVLEALACGIPVVTTSDAFSDGGLPVTVVKDTPESLMRGIRTVSEEANDRVALADTVKRGHSLPACISQIILFYKE